VRCSLGCRRLRRIWRNGKALFRHLLLQIGGASIGKLVPSSLFAKREACFNEVAKLSAAAVFWNKVKQFERESAGSEVEAIKAVQAGPTDLAVVPVRS
jgi:hypothetical protein